MRFTYLFDNLESPKHGSDVTLDTLLNLSDDHLEKPCSELSIMNSKYTDMGDKFMRFRTRVKAN